MSLSASPEDCIVDFLVVPNLLKKKKNYFHVNLR